MPADMIHDTVWAQELIDEGRAEATHTHTMKNLEYRGIEHREALLITKALLDENFETSVQRAAFDDLEQLKALVGRDG